MVDRYIAALQENEESLLKENFVDLKLRKIRFTLPLLEILKNIESKPLRIDDMRLLRAAMAEFAQKYEIHTDKELIRLITRRFSMAFLPGISISGVDDYVVALDRAGHKSLLEKYLPCWNEVDESAKQPVKSSPVNSIRNHTQQQQQQQEAHFLLERSVMGPLSKQNTKYYLCSFRRHQSALWTSYRLFLDGIKDFNAQGECINIVQLEHPMMLLGAKKLKSGISAQCFVWKTEDSKYWKEKLAIGKITRSGTIYTGIPSVQVSSVSSLIENDAEEPPTENNPSDTSSSVPTSASQVSPDTAGEVSSDPSTTASKRHSDSLDESINRDLLDGGPVSIAVQSKGQEKLIQLTIALQKPSSRNTVPGQSHEASTHDLEQLVRNPLGFSASSSNLGTPEASATAVTDASLPYIVLRSKLPRKIGDGGSTDATSPTTSNTSAVDKNNASSNGGTSAASASSSQFGVTFGKTSRIRYASRKNVAADIWIDFQSNQKRIAVNNDWSSDNTEVPPLLQV